MQVSQQDLGGHITSNSTSLKNVEKDAKVEPLRLFEARIEALMKIITNRSPEEHFSMNVAELRSGIEQMPKHLFERFGYFPKWAVAIARAGLNKKWWSEEDLQKCVGIPVTKPRSQRFEIGQKVLVRSENCEIAWRRPHLRTPGYLHEKIGEIVGLLPSEIDPDVEAFSNLFSDVRGSAKTRVYRVRFRSKDVWPRVNVVVPDDEIDVEVFEDWLQPSRKTDDHNTNQSENNNDELLKQQHDDKNENDHHHHHHHDHDHEHEHEERATVEQTAVVREGPPVAGERFSLALVQLALQKAVVTQEQLHAKIESLANLNFEPARRLVARCWLDDKFRAKLLNETTANEAVKELTGIEMQCKFVVVANDVQVWHVVCCTLCSCFPTQVLGRPPLWYKEAAYRSRVVVEPRAVLSEFGVTLLPNQRVRVVDSTSECRYMVLPMRPDHAAHLKTEEELMALISRDSLIGVANL